MLSARSVVVRGSGRVLFAVACSVLALPRAYAADKLTYLLPAPFELPAFAAYVLARERGYFAEEGLEISFQVGKGGIDVAKQVGAGTVDLGNGPGDASIIVRPNGVPIKLVAMLGGGSLAHLVVNAASPIQSLSDLKGRTVSVMSYQDGTYYALLGMLSAVGLTQKDVDIQAAGPAGVWQLVLSGKSDAMAAVPDWIGSISDSGGVPRIVPTDQYFVGMPQAILASDRAIRENPERIRRMIRATLRGIADIMRDPDDAARAYVKAMPQYVGREASITRVLNLYATLVFRGSAPLGSIDPARLEKTQTFYLEHDIIPKRTPLAELYTSALLSPIESAR